MEAFDTNETKEGKGLLHRIVSMLTKMTERNDVVREDSLEYITAQENEDEI